ncbi:MAG: tetratricopeptide repeat protein [Bacteroidetes bacterium]|nr:tetratricopeptide repeat protein [Bacteroidota bacterium]
MRFVLSLSLLLISTDVVAQRSILDLPEVQKPAKAGLEALYDFRFAEADSLFGTITKRHPDHPIGPFLEALTLWWTILLNLNDTSYDQTFYAAMDEVIDRSDFRLKRNDNDFDAIFFKGISLGFRGRLRSNRRDWIRAAADGKRAMDYVLAVADVDSLNHDYKLGRGLYRYYAALIPSRYPFLRPITTFLPPGNRHLGLNDLYQTARNGNYLQTEAMYFLVQINYLYEKNFQDCVEQISWLRNRYPRNSFFHTLEGRIYASWHQWRASDEVFEDVLERYKALETGYSPLMAEQALYFLARSHIIKGQAKDALTHLLSLEALTARLDTDSYFKVAGRLNQGIAHDLLGQRQQAIARYKEVLKMQRWGSSHTNARKFLTTPYGSVDDNG